MILKQEAQDFCDYYGYEFAEISALTQDGLKDAFDLLIRAGLNKQNKTNKSKCLCSCSCCGCFKNILCCRSKNDHDTSEDIKDEKEPDPSPEKGTGDRMGIRFAMIGGYQVEKRSLTEKWD